MPPVDQFRDDGTLQQIYLMPSSSAPGVLGVDRGTRGYVVKGVSSGIASLTFSDHGVTETLSVQVVP